jgi:hypothetical protein
MGPLHAYVSLEQHVEPKYILEGRRFTHQTISITTEELLRRLVVDLTYFIRETEHILRQSNSLRPQALGKARWLLSTVQFKNWLERPFSGILLVDGYCKDDGIGKISPLSVFCASLATTLRQTSSGIVLHFFCGSHSRIEQDPVSGPAGLIRSLITQLLLYPDSPDVYLDPMEQNLYEAVSHWNVQALVFLFGLLVCKMHESKTIICLIDGISDFETPLHGWDRQILDVVQQLRSIVDRQRPGPALKLLMTSANRALDIGLLVHQHQGEHVSLRAGNVNDRPIHGFGFDQDVQRMLVPSSQQSSLLKPGNWVTQKDGMQQENPYVGRPRSSGSNLPGS